MNETPKPRPRLDGASSVKRGTRSTGKPGDGGPSSERRWWRWGVHLIGLVLAAVALVLPWRVQPSFLPPGWIYEVSQLTRPDYEPTLISPQALWAAVQRPDGPVIIDVRHPTLYADSHIRGAINVPVSELPAHLERVPKGVKLALYCS